jgi:citrate synthase
MLIGKAGPATSSLCTADAASIHVRGLDLANELMGQFTFTEFFFFLVTGAQPTEKQRYFLDVLLVSIAEHGLTPTAQTARMTLAADPDCLQGAVAAGILGCGTVVLGTSDLCARLLVEAQSRVRAGEASQTVADELAADIRRRREKMPGFGHPLHQPLDPRAERILHLAEQHGVGGPHLSLAKAFKPAVEKAWGRPLPMNVSMPIAAVLLDLDFPAAIIKGIPILARTAGILGHLAEEQERPIGFLMSHHAENAIAYEPSEGSAR